MIEGGQEYDFSFNGGTYAPTTPARQDTLVANGATLVWTDLDGEKTTFTQIGTTGAWQVSGISSLGGMSRAFTYSGGVLSSMTDEFGRTASFTFTNGNVSQITWPDGSTSSYTYAAVVTALGYSGNLVTSIVHSLGSQSHTITYEYEDTNLADALTGITDERGVRYATWAWNDYSRRVASAQLAGGADQTTFTYNDGSAYGPHSTRTLTNPLGKQGIYTFSYDGGKWVIIGFAGQASSHCPASSNSITYSSTTQFITQRTDELGNQTTYLRDTSGKETSRTEGSGTSAARTITTAWNANFSRPSTIAEATHKTDFTYDVNGDVLTKVITDLTNFTTPYATNGRTRTWTYTYTAQGLLATAKDPLGDTTSYSYNASGYLTKVTDALSHVTQITAINGRGEPTTVVDPNGVTSQLTYDMDGHLTGVTLNPGGTQSVYTFAYDASGDLTQITLPLGGYLKYTYDNARRLTDTTNVRGEQDALILDAAGDVTAEQYYDSSNAYAMNHANTFDELARLLTSVGANGETTTYGYDLAGNPTQVTDGRGNLFKTAFDPLNRLISQTDPESHTVSYGLDASDQLVSHADGRGLVTSREVDGFGQVIQQVSPDTGTSTYAFDAGGNLTRKVNGNAIETDYTYDKLNRALTKTFPKGAYENIAYTYDATASGNYGVGRLTSFTDVTGSTALKYDAQGRVVTIAKTIQGNAFSTAYAYDANGKVTAITYPSGRVVSFTRTTDGLVTGVTTKPSSTGTASTVASSVVYRPFGPLYTLTYGNGLALQRLYGQNYWLLGISVTGTSPVPLNLTINRDAAGSISNIADNAATGRGASYAFTPSGRLQTATGAWGQYAYKWDGAGNMTERDQTVGGATTYGVNVFPSTSNQIAQTTDNTGHVLRTFQSFAGGEENEDDRSGAATYDYIYDFLGRIVGVNLNGVNVGGYGYDAFGARVWRQVISPSTAATQYVFDLDGRLLAEHDGVTGKVLKEYVWIDDMATAVIDSTSGTAKTYYIHTGPVNEPLVMTDASKAQVWNAYMEPFGAATVFGSNSAAIDLRLPGQWLQAETGGLNQNWFRDYDPSLGRYLQPDPLGLEAGQNPFAYVDGDPLDSKDISGLQAIPMLPPIPWMPPPRNITPQQLQSMMNDVGGIIKFIGSPFLPNNQCHMDKNDPGRKDHCDKQYDADVEACNSRYSYGAGSHRRCINRAGIIYKQCLSGEPELPPWSDINEDGWTPPRPPRRH